MTEQYIGLMSGTSLDAMDAVLVSFNNHKPNLIASHELPINKTLRSQILELCSSGHNEIERLAVVDKEVAQLSAQAISELLERCKESPTNIRAIGSHGQTIRHRPDRGFTLQAGDPNLLTELTGITVVADFRRRDMAAGGQGAPLVPAFHKAVFSSKKESRVIVNIGGISNISILPSDNSLPVTGFDTGPGNMLMDYWCHKHQGTPFDRNGKWAASASPNQTLLSAMMTEHFFHKAPPKSTGRELFNPDWLTKQLKPFPHLNPATIQASLCRLTALGITHAIKHHAPDTQAVFICGGGSKNKTLMEMLKSELDGMSVSSTLSLGIDPSLVEATAFAWLAQQTLNQQPGNLPDVTGAKGMRVLGGIYSH